MATDSPSDSRLKNVYEDRIGDPTTADEARGYWLFAIGLIIAVLGVLLFLPSSRATPLRQWSIVLASTGLVFLIAGPIIRLPLESVATTIVYVGVVIAVLAMAWFVTAYPAQWGPQTGHLGIIALYAVGVLVIGASGAFVPVMTDRDGTDAEIEALQADKRELRESAAKTDEAEQDRERLEAEIADLESALAEAETANADLQRDVDQLQSEVAGGQEDQAHLTALLREHKESESQFELYRDRGGDWRWRLRHTDGQVIASSNEGWASKNDAQQEMQAVRRDALGASVLHVETEDDLPEAGSDDGFVYNETTESKATYELYVDEGEEYRWRLRHDNGNIIAHAGQGYASKSGAEHSIERIRDYIGPAEYLQPDPTAIDVYLDEEGQWRWRLHHKNGNILAGSGEGYESRGGARRAVDRLREGIEDMEIEVYEDDDGGYRWRLEGDDDLVKADSGQYESRDGASEAVERVRDFLPEADIVDVGEAAFEIYVDEGGEPRWRMMHRNGQVIASSGEGYSSRSDVYDAIESVKQNGPAAEIEETEN